MQRNPTQGEQLAALTASFTAFVDLTTAQNRTAVEHYKELNDHLAEMRLTLHDISREQKQVQERLVVVEKFSDMIKAKKGVAAGIIIGVTALWSILLAIALFLRDRAAAVIDALIK